MKDTQDGIGAAHSSDEVDLTMVEVARWSTALACDPWGLLSRLLDLDVAGEHLDVSK